MATTETSSKPIKKRIQIEVNKSPELVNGPMVEHEGTGRKQKNRFRVIVMEEEGGLLLPELELELIELRGFWDG
jgi:hypothetical protein